MSLRSEDFKILALNPPILLDCSIPIAASRAGHTGIFDLQYAPLDRSVVRAALDRFAAQARGAWGVKLDAAQVAAFADARAEIPRIGDMSVALLVPTSEDDLAAAIATLRMGNADLCLAVEVRNHAEAEAATAAGADVLVAKGHEAAGVVGSETAFLLVQRLVAMGGVPVYAQGGVSTETAAALRVAGAAGVLLDWQLALTEEAALPTRLAATVARLDGSETYLLGADGDLPTRIFARTLRDVPQRLQDLDHAGAGLAQLPAAIAAQVDPLAPEASLCLMGQDATFAAGLAQAHGRTGAVLDAIATAVETRPKQAARAAALAEGSPLTETLGTRYPIVQGPMTRVSDRAAFAKAVSEGGALPFLALALMRRDEVDALVAETFDTLGDRPFGVGILGFVDDALREEQMQVILARRPKFALIAGGRPEQALDLEREGIPTYLHVPSPGLLKLFLEAGVRRFVFEGRECGGHVGPRSSAVLWQQAVDTITAYFGDARAEDCEVLFAGGLHDAASGAMVSTLAAPLTELGVKVGIVIGTGYILTEEAVSTGAVQDTYQRMALEARATKLLESGVGHATRVVDSPIVQEFYSEKSRMRSEKIDAEEIKDTLERFNVGRSRIASKGVDRNPAFGKVEGAEKLIAVGPEDQFSRGLYMIGQVAGLHHAPTTIAALHADVCAGSVAHLAPFAPAELAPTEPIDEGPGTRIAITGIGTILPGAAELSAYWENILDRVDAIQEVPERRWDWRRYFDPDRDARDKTYSKWGGFIDEVTFDPLHYGIPPNSMPSIEPLQLLALEVVRAALENAGFKDGVIPDPEIRRKTCVIIGVGGGAGPMGQRYAVRSSLPAIEGRIPETSDARLPEWTEDSFPGILLNVIAGRVANRFDLGGVNFTVDAACGSSLAAVMMASRELESGAASMAIVGGVDSFQNPFDFIAFSKTRALSPRGRCRTFDASADGIAISEGLAVMVMRPLAAAEAAGDRIYAVLRGVAGASDGRDLSLTAPRPEGQQETLRRAYERAGISPGTVSLVEAHGTGTVVGDRTEIESLSAVFAEARSDLQYCGVGSVKSMIGHTKAAAGCAGMAKVALALHHRTLPSTLNIEDPNPSANFDQSPFYPATEARPWLRHGETPRRGGVSAFGFGGTNFHAVLEEYDGGYLPKHQEPFRRNWSTELFVFSADDVAALKDSLTRAADGIAALPASVRAADVAASLAAQFDAESGARLAIPAASLVELADRLRTIAGGLDPAKPALRQADLRGAYVAADAPLNQDQVAFLFPGQGSQYPGMASDLAMTFPMLRETVERASRLLDDVTPDPLGDRIYPRPTLDTAERAAQIERLKQTNIAQPAIGTVSAGMLGILRRLGLCAGQAAGHSFGEYTALHAAGAFDADTLVKLGFARGDAIITMAGDDLGAMIAVNADAETVRAALDGIEGVTLANINAPDQTVLAGPTPAIDRAEAALSQTDFTLTRLPVACGFHSECVAPGRDRLAEVLAATTFAEADMPVIANATAAPYPQDTEAMKSLLADHLVTPVNFLGGVECMHDRGARLFIEIGPGSVLTRLTAGILAGRPHTAVATDSKSRGGVHQFLSALGAAVAAGLPLDLAQLFERRARSDLDVTTWQVQEDLGPRAATLWKVDAANARPINGEPARRGFAARIEEDPAPVAPPAMSPPVPQPAAAPAPVAATPAPTPVSRPTQVAPAPIAPQPAMTGSVAGPETAQLMQRHQALMQQFLQNHRDVMMSWIGSGGAQPAGTLPQTVAAPQPVVAAPTPPVSTRPVPTPTVPPVPAATPAPQPAPVPQPAVVTPTPAPVAATPQLAADAVAASLLELIADRTGYPTEMLEPTLDLEADLGIDSIKRVEILGELRNRWLAEAGEAAREKMGPVARERTVEKIVARFMEVASEFAGAAPEPAPMAAPAPVAATPQLAADAVAASLLELIADRTGYPTDMLEPTLDLEADLGIDSIKRVEILGELRNRWLAEAGEAAREKMGPVARERTVEKIVARFMEVASEFAGAAPEPAPMAAPAPMTATPQLAADAVAASLLELIADRTGYPTEMLEPTLDLEADLGIDSIKRVEILGELRNRWLAEAGEAAREKMGPVARERTVEKIVARFMEVASEFAGATPAPTPLAAPEALRKDLTDWRARFVMVPLHVAAQPANPVLMASRAYILAGPESPLRAALIQRIKAAGGVPVTINAVDDADIRAAIAGIDQEIGGVFHLWPVQSRPDFADMARDDWSASVTEDLRCLYTLLSTLGARMAGAENGFVVAASCMGGAFGFDDGLTAAPSAAGAAGLMKSAAKEWETLTIRAVDLDPDMPVEAMAQTVIDEAGRPGGAVEIGWKDGLRFELSAEPRPFVYDAGHAVEGLGAEDVVLVTGGARGITARIVKHLAAHHSARFVLMGSTPMGDTIPSDLVGLTDPRAVRGKLVTARKAAGRPMVPAEIEAETRQIVRSNEIAETLATVRASGCAVEYVTADVRDADGFHAAVQGVYDRYGRIDVAIHGAGVIDDKLIADKTLDSFERVVRTKTDSAFTLVRALRPDTLKSLVFFASVAGRFGNRGQGDYGAANEIVSKLARNLDATWPGQVIAISWGPWDSGGMVTAEIKAQFQKLGIEAIPPDCGVAALEVELQQNAKSAPEVVWGRGPWENDAVRHLKVAE